MYSYSTPGSPGFGSCRSEVFGECMSSSLSVYVIALTKEMYLLCRGEFGKCDTILTSIRSDITRQYTKNILASNITYNEKF